jgi:hypothetical protein
MMMAIVGENMVRKTSLEPNILGDDSFSLSSKKSVGHSLPI